MNTKVKQLWIEALRSGEYKQGQQALRNTCEDKDYFCCLGVLSDLYRKEHPVSAEWDHHESTNLWTFNVSEPSYQCVGNILPLTVVQWAELPDSNPRVKFAGERLALAYVNDRGIPFTKIADIIEEQL